MKRKDFLQPALRGLATLQIILTKKGGPSSDGDLFEQILDIQDTILSKFGLPASPDNEALLFFNSDPSDDEINVRIEQLNEEATKYLSSKTKTDLQILRGAQLTKQDPMYVLPELKIRTHSYTLFVYNNILLKEKDSPENVLLELKMINDYPYILGLLGRMEQGILDNESDVIEFLEKIGVRYIQQFKLHNSNSRK